MNVWVTGPSGSVIEVWDLESMTVFATNIANPGSPTIFAAQPNRRYGGFGWYTDNSQRNIEIFARNTAPTTSTPDTQYPIVSNLVSTNVTSNSMSITWTTNELSDSQVEYGRTNSYGSTTPLDAGLVISHSVLLSQLLPNTTYYIKAKTKDAAGNLTMGTIIVQTTAAPAVQQKPITVTYPNGGQYWYIGTPYTITWDNPLSAGFSGDGNYRWLVALKKGNSEYVNAYVPVTQSSNLLQSWSPFITAGSDYYAEVILHRNCSYSPGQPCPEPNTILSGPEFDLSDAPFHIYPYPTISLTTTAPNGGENWQEGSTNLIRWSFAHTGTLAQDNGPHPTKIVLQKVNTDGSFSDVTTITTSISTNAGENQHQWVIPPGLSGSNYRMKVEITSFNAASSLVGFGSRLDESNQNFSIATTASSSPSSTLQRTPSTAESAFSAIAEILKNIRGLLLKLR